MALYIIYKRMKQKRVLRKLKYIGENPCIHDSVRFRNPERISIGDQCYIAENGVIEAWDRYNDKAYQPSIIIGNNVKINAYCHIGAINKIEIGDDCLLGSHVMLIDHSHGKNDLDELKIHPAYRDLYSRGTVIVGKGVWLCENVVVLPGVNIGDGAVIGANTVVTKNVPSNCVFAGNPGRIIKCI